MKISFIIKKLVGWFNHNHVLNIASVMFFLLYALPALASQEAPSSRSGSILNILLLGCIAYFLVRSFRRRFGGDDKPRPGNEGDDTKVASRSIGKLSDKHEAARQAWNVLSSDKGKPVIVPSPVVSAGSFNESEFLEGAKLFFTRFQQARNSQELDNLRGFISDEVYSEAVAETQRNPTSAHVEIVLLNVRLMEKKTEAGKTFTTVFFDAQIRRGDIGEQPVHIRAVWEFFRDDTVSNGLWILEKINKVDQ